MPKQVNIVLDSGRVVSVDEETAALAQRTGNVRAESAREGVTREVRDANAEGAQGLEGTATAALGGALDTATLGASSALLMAAGGSAAQRYKAEAEEHSTARFVGETAALLAPTGWLGNTAKVASEAAPIFRITSKLGGKLGEGTAKALLAEGAIYGVGGHIAETAISGDPLTIESTLHAAGIGAILNFGLGKVTGAIFGKTSEVAAKEAKRIAEVEAKDTYTAAKTAYNKLLSDADATAATQAADNAVAIKKAQADLNLAKGEANTVADEHAQLLKLTPPEYDALIQAQRATKQAEAKAQKEAVDQFDALTKSQEKLAKEFDKLKVASDKAKADYAEQLAQYQDKFDVIHESSKAATNFVKLHDEARNLFGSLTITLRRKGMTPEQIALELSGIDFKLKNALANYDRGDSKSAIGFLAEAYSGIKQIRPSFKIPEGAKYPTKPTPPPEFNLTERPVIPDPSLKPTIVPDTSPNFPKTLGDLADMDVPTIEKLANSIKDGSDIHAALNRFAESAGLQPSATAGETLAGLHASLQDVKLLASSKPQSLIEALKALDDAKIKEAADTAAAVQARQQLLQQAPIAPPTPSAPASTAAGQGGLFGRLAGVALRISPAGVATAAVTGSFQAARMLIGQSLHAFFLRFGQTAAAISKGLQPVVSTLGASVLTGEDDNKGDVREQALRRIDELNKIQMMSNDASYMALQSIVNFPNDVAFKMHDKVTSAINYLMGVAPKDNGLSMNMFKSDWKPTYAEAMKFASQVEAVMKPMDAIKRLIAGGGTQEAANALWDVYPATMQGLAAGLANNAVYLQNLTREQSSALGRLFRIPLNGFQTPQVLSTVQAIYFPVAPAGSDSTSRPPSRMPTGNPSGRPPVFSGFNDPSASRVQQLQR